MNEFASVDELFDFAIHEEEMAAKFYTRMAERQEQDWMKQVFEGFAREEKGHKIKLENMRNGKYFKSQTERIPDLKIADYVVDVPATGEMSFPDALVLAMKKEKAAFRLYMNLSEKVSDPDIRDTLVALAQEEAKHKLRFEIEYDEYVYQEN